jgi:hypothetical protein
MNVNGADCDAVRGRIAASSCSSEIPIRMPPLTNERDQIAAQFDLAGAESKSLLKSGSSWSIDQNQPGIQRRIPWAVKVE